MLHQLPSALGCYMLVRVVQRHERMLQLQNGHEVKTLAAALSCRLVALVCAICTSFSCIDNRHIGKPFQTWHSTKYPVSVGKSHLILQIVSNDAISFAKVGEISFHARIRPDSSR